MSSFNHTQTNILVSSLAVHLKGSFNIEGTCLLADFKGSKGLHRSRPFLASSREVKSRTVGGISVAVNDQTKLPFKEGLSGISQHWLL